MNLPSSSNTYGSLAGLVSGFIATKLVTAGAVVTVAAFLGVPPLWVAGAVGVIAASAVNYGVTHWAELKEVDNLVAALPKTYQEYPGAKQTPAAQTNLKLKS